MPSLGFLYGSSAAARGADRIPTVFPADVEVSTYSPDPVVYSEEESAYHAKGPPPQVRRFFNKWIQGNSSAVRRYKYQTYGDDGLYGSIWVQFTTGSKQYNYPNVPWHEFVIMSKAPSKGKYVNYVLRPNYSVGQGRHWRMARGRKAAGFRVRVK